MATLYCPFCAQAFPGAYLCPSCGLDLVTSEELAALQKRRERALRPANDRFLTLRRGKGPVLLGVAIFAVAYFLPWLEVGERSFSGLRLAHAARLLWAIPAAALTLTGVIVSRRTAQEQAGARLVAMLLALVPAVASVWAVMGGLRALSAIERAAVSIRYGWVLEIAGALVAAVSVPFFGRERRPSAPASTAR